MPDPSFKRTPDNAVQVKCQTNEPTFLNCSHSGNGPADSLRCLLRRAHVRLITYCIGHCCCLHPRVRRWWHYLSRPFIAHHRCNHAHAALASHGLPHCTCCKRSDRRPLSSSAPSARAAEVQHFIQAESTSLRGLTRRWLARRCTSGSRNARQAYLPGQIAEQSSHALSVDL